MFWSKSGSKFTFFPLQLCAACVEKCFVGREIAVFSPFHERFSVAILKFLKPTLTVLMRFIEIFIWNSRSFLYSRELSHKKQARDPGCTIVHLLCNSKSNYLSNPLIDWPTLTLRDIHNDRLTWIVFLWYHTKCFITNSQHVIQLLHMYMSSTDESGTYCPQ